jgi:Lon protease-like protein
VPELGLFPLAMVLLPTERVPLHVFEPRYKELIGECLSEGVDFGLLLEDAAGRRDVGTRAAVVEVLQVFDDGRLNIVVEGRERFRVVEPTAGRSFLTAEVETVADDAAEGDPADVARAWELFRRLVEITEAEIEEPTGDPEQLSFELAACVDFGPELKQELLELQSEPARLRRLNAALDRAVQAMLLEREVRERASGNGRVSPRS